MRTTYQCCRVEVLPYNGRWRWLVKETCSGAIVRTGHSKNRKEALADGKTARVEHMEAQGIEDGRAKNRPPSRRKKRELELWQAEEASA